MLPLRPGSTQAPAGPWKNMKVGGQRKFWAPEHRDLGAPATQGHEMTGQQHGSESRAREGEHDKLKNNAMLIPC